MGGILTTAVADNMRAFTGIKRRRDETDDVDSESDSSLEKTLHTPKRKKLMSTAQYIYQALFKEGTDSDVTLIALGTHWKLHKLYLSQSLYFRSMFSGSWKEATEGVVQIEIVDPVINHDSLYTVFGSLYLDELILEPINVVPTLATATLFQLEGIIDQCTEIMEETINVETVIKYYEAACKYGVPRVKEATFKWLLINLLSDFQEQPKQLLEMRSELLEKLVASPELFVLQTEFSLYVLLRFWLFLQFNPDWEKLAKDSYVSVQQFFHNREDEEFLLTSEGKHFAAPFRALRLQHLVNHLQDVEMLKCDRIVPLSWITPAAIEQWCGLLRIDHGSDIGPNAMDEEEFSKSAIRCGRMFLSPGDNVWRWTGFNMGLDLIWTCNSRSLRVKRSHRTEQHEIVLGMHQRRRFICRVTFASLDEQKQVKRTQSSGLKTVQLSKNEECPLLILDKELTYPLLLSVNIFVNTPIKQEQSLASSANEDGRKCPKMTLSKLILFILMWQVRTKMLRENLGFRKPIEDIDECKRRL